MAKAPRRPVSKPADGGALPRRVQPRNARGVFCKADEVVVDDAVERPATKQRRAAKTPAPRKRARRSSTPAQLVTRVTRAIEGELDQIEDIMHGAKVSPAQRSEAEKRARTLASLTRTLAEMTKLREAEKEAKADHDDDAVPRDLDDFRRTLERRLAQMADPQPLAPDRRDEPGGDGVD